jgi:hypothetical protein
MRAEARFRPIRLSRIHEQAASVVAISGWIRATAFERSKKCQVLLLRNT